MKKVKFIFAAFIITLLMVGKRGYSQDTIVKRNLDIIIVKINEISATVIKYHRMDMVDGPSYSILKSDVAVIKYSNGMKDVFNSVNTNDIIHDATSQPSPSSSSDVKPDTVPRYTLILNDGTQLKGKIVKQNAKEVTFLDNSIGEKTILRTKIKSLTSEYTNNDWVFTLTDGSIITGKLVNKNSSYTIVKTKDLGTINLPENKIKSAKIMDDASVNIDGKIWFRNPNCTRYLFAPSAIPLKRNEGYYQNIYGAFNAVNYGLTNNISIGGGITGPVGIYLNTKIGFKLVNNVHFAFGGLIGNGFLQVDDNNFGLGIGFAVLTFGNYDHNITVGTGYGFIDKDGQTQNTDKPLFVVNGMVRVNKKFALVSENWIVNIKGNPFNRSGDWNSKSNKYDALFSYAFRYMNEQTTLDAGFLNTPALIEQGWYIGVPFIGFVVRFGNYKEKS